MLSALLRRPPKQSPDQLALDRIALHMRQSLSSPSDSKVFVITSAGPKEGKTVISRLLAQSAARQQEGDVLWLDAGISPIPGQSAAGFAEVMAGGSVEELARSTSQPHYWQMVRGDKYHASQLFQGGRLRASLQRMRQRFPLIVIDAPELPACGALLALADEVLVVVDAQKTTGYMVQKAMDTALSLAGVGRERISGVIINRQTRGLFS